MTGSPAELIERLHHADFNERAKALAELVRQGRPAAGPLLRVLDSEDDSIRSHAARALAEIADPDSADRLAEAVDDRDSVVRASAALGLMRIGDARALQALVKTVDDFPDEDHDPYTSSVYALIDLGPPALPAVAPLLAADDPRTRLRAWAIVSEVAPTIDEGRDWNALWQSLGSYDPNADAEHVQVGAAAWASWIAEHAVPPAGP